MASSTIDLNTSANVPRLANSRDHCAPPILRLPSSLRRRIFFFAGLYCNAQIDLDVGLGSQRSDHIVALDRELERERKWRQHPYVRTTRVPGDRLALDLLLTCSLFYRDAVSAICETNNIRLTLNRPRALAPLRALSPYFVSKLRILTLGIGSYRYEDHDRYDVGCGMNQLSCKRKEDRALVHSWLLVWHCYIEPHLPQDPKLDLRLICRVADKEILLKVLQPLLRCSRPLLRSCSIRLVGHCEGDRIVSLLEEAVSTAAPLSRERNSGPFRFNDLPVELRHWILKDTGLVCPDSVFNWIPQAYRAPTVTNEDFFVGKAVHGWFLFDPSQYDVGCSAPDGREFCQTRYTARTNDPRLQCVESCWRFPIGLFLVSHQMRDEALEVLYSENRHRFHPGCRLESGWRSAPTQFPGTDFLCRTVSSHSLQHLRFLEFVFPTFEAQALKDASTRGNNVLQRWANTLRSVRHDLIHPALTIRVVLTRWIARYAARQERERRDDDEESYIACYADIVRPFSLLKRPARFFVHLPYVGGARLPPVRGARGTELPKMHGYPVIDRATVEASLERLVMGDSYNAETVGKGQEPSIKCSTFYEHIGAFHAQHEPGSSM